ncbi:hypothetical protein RND81_08G079200 [Saponaria officinalis]|uniref:Uncharacterized protein n=1 Tax=Saponaria officinalis TaxID=3572 RepID=A0AAW1J749_SAPOF
MHHISIKLPRTPQKQMTSIHGNHIAQHFIRIRIHRKTNLHLFCNLNLLLVIKPMQSIRFRIRCSKQAQPGNHLAQCYIRATGTIDNHATPLVSDLAFGIEKLSFLFRITRISFGMQGPKN